jgi:hypothetical protein
MVDHIATNITGPIDGVAPPNIPLTPKREDYQLLNYYNPDTWLNIKNKGGRGPRELSIESPIISLFMEDEFGNPIPETIKGKLRGDLIAYWNEVHRSGELLRNFTETGITRKDDFRKFFEGKYNWLRLCEGRWKVDQLWINYFGTWKKNHSSLPATPEPPAALEDATPGPNDVASGAGRNPDVSTISTSHKRRLEESETRSEDSVKRHQGMSAIQPTKFHHSRPQPRKKGSSKIAKVSSRSLLFVRCLLIGSRILCKF